jgi:CheY-like chemotaxis protein
MNSRRSELTVLVVEDELLLRMELVDHLQDAGWNTQEAGTGEAAVVLLDREPKIDFLITDIRLGGLVDGWSVAERFRAIHPGGAVIYISANPDLATRRVRDSAFLGKPVEMKTVLGTCDRLVLQP